MHGTSARVICTNHTLSPPPNLKQQQARSPPLEAAPPLDILLFAEIDIFQSTRFAQAHGLPAFESHASNP
eukprot:1140624-Pelagomonas_calceolata.AAC.2